MRISDWSSDVCSSDLVELARDLAIEVEVGRHPGQGLADLAQRFQRHRRLAATRVEAARDVEARPRALQPVGLVRLVGAGGLKVLPPALVPILPPAVPLRLGAGAIPPPLPGKIGTAACRE